MTATTTIIIPTHRGQKFLPRALESLKQQTYQDFDVVVVSDDGFDYLPLAQSVLGERVHHIFTDKPASGPTPAREAGLKVTQSKVVGFLDVDDEYAPRRLERLVPLALEYGAATSNIKRFDDATRAYINQSIPNGMPLGGFLKEKHVPWLDGPLVPLVRRDCLAPYPDMWLFEDLFFLMRVIGRMGGAMPVVDNDDTLYRYLIQKHSLSYGTDKDEMTTRYYEQVLADAEHGGPLFEGASQDARVAFLHCFGMKAKRDRAYTVAKASEPDLDFYAFSPSYDDTMAQLAADVPEHVRAWAP
jgi:glycosyltransferase involved in cell wall biosynthesis